MRKKVVDFKQLRESPVHCRLLLKNGPYGTLVVAMGHTDDGYEAWTHRTLRSRCRARIRDKRRRHSSHTALTLASEPCFLSYFTPSLRVHAHYVEVWVQEAWRIVSIYPYRAHMHSRGAGR